MRIWYRPIASPEHGVYVVLLVSFLTGVAAAQNWNWNTTLALIAAFCGFQAEHPWILQIKQRKSWKPRFLLWGGLYSSIALAIAAYLYWQQGLGWSLLLAIYLGAAIASSIVLSLYLVGWLSPITAAAFTISLLKFGLILWQREWYCTAKIQSIAMLETGNAVLFLTVTALSLLPAHF